MPDHRWCSGHLLLVISHRVLLTERLVMMILADVDALVEQQNAAIANRLERGDVATIETAGDARARIRAGQLHLGMRARTQTRGGFDERRAAADIEERHQLTGAKHGVRSPARAATRAAALAPAFNQVDRYWCHCRVCASNINTRTRPVAPKTRIAICGPR